MALGNLFCKILIFTENKSNKFYLLMRSKVGNSRWLLELGHSYSPLSILNSEKCWFHMKAADSYLRNTSLFRFHSRGLSHIDFSTFLLRRQYCFLIHIIIKI